MQEEVENKTLTLAISSAKFTGRTLKSAITQYMSHRRGKKAQKATVHPQGKQTVRQLLGQNQGVSNIELSDPDIRDFERVARKYGVDYAIKRDRTVSPPKYLVFFKGRDADAITSAFQEFTAKKVKKQDRPSVLEKLSQLVERLKNVVTDRTREKELER